MDQTKIIVFNQFTKTNICNFTCIITLRSFNNIFIVKKKIFFKNFLVNKYEFPAKCLMQFFYNGIKCTLVFIVVNSLNICIYFNWTIL